MKPLYALLILASIIIIFLAGMLAGKTIPEVIIEKEYVPKYIILENSEKLREQSVQIDGLRYEVAVRDKRIVELEAMQADLELTLELTKRTSGLQPFRTFDELRVWLANNPVSEREYSSPDYVCTDFAYDLMFDAWRDGKIMGIARFSSQQHQKAFTLIGRHIVEIDPTTDGITSDEDWVYRGWNEWVDRR